MNERDDHTLVKETLEGNKRAFEVLVVRYQKPVFNAAFRIINDYNDAADVTQTVFLKAYRNLRSFNSQYKFFSWLYRIATNESLNYVKSRKQFDVLSDELESQEKTPDQSFDESETSETIQNALMGLSVEQRIVVVLCHFHDLSYKEMSYILEISEKKVKSRLFSARRTLRTILVKDRHQ